LCLGDAYTSALSTTAGAPRAIAMTPVNLSNTPATWNRFAPEALSLLRIVSAYLFLLHGSAKLLKFPQIDMFANLQIMSLGGIAGIIELVGGVLVLIGLFTRPAAFIMSGTMAFAYFIGHASKGNPLFPLMNGGEAAVLFCFVFLFIAAAGAGPWSVDAMMKRGRT
jgi:putative oxidoreductase